ncbi:ABC transporter ATP-binding protein [Jannaschia marina]|uniref:ABC transporter ATP-binding protein n=1 Tax=Jannaschia marina TaxID=2741674 RepID=UPI0015C9DEAA|nr:sn-glycerol-3-phosphate ABC transporter ATP-binding protein UgpC [Jannaschia marina]
MASITLDNVRKSYGALEVVHGLSLDIAEGEFTVLVGPSGCGKSTLLRMIAGLEDITDGTVRVGDTVVNDLPPRKRDIAMVFQSYALYPHKSVRKNMAFSLEMAGAPKTEIAEKVARAAEILDLTPLLDRKPAALSGGQRQRVAMGRAIVRSPKLFLFDEPLSNLDAKLRVQMRAEIKELHQRLRTTTVYVTHDQVEAMTMADRIVVMNAGNIEQIGAPMELYDDPQSRFVAEFIGSPAMNILDGTFHPGGRFVLPDGGEIALGGAAPAVDSPRKAGLGVRPENLSHEPGGIVLGTARVRVVEPMGSETLMTVTVGGRSLLVLDRTRRPVAVGDALPVHAAPGDLFFFDGKTDRRI